MTTFTSPALPVDPEARPARRARAWAWAALRAAALPLSVAILSSALSWGACTWAEAHFRKEQGYWPDRPMVLGTVFRFDSVYYESIAATGYAYAGSPCPPSNIVFMPLYSLAVRFLSALTGLGIVTSGAVVSQVAFAAALLVLAGALRRMLGARAALFVIAGLAFSSASVYFHAFYAESVTLLALALCVDAWQRRQPVYLAVASGLLSASRPPMLPLSGMFALYLAWRAVREVWPPPAPSAPPSLAAPEPPSGPAPVRRRGWRAAGLLALSAVAVSGCAAYLGYLHLAFARPAGYPHPLALIHAIHRCAWARYFAEMSGWDLLTLRHLWSYVPGLFSRRPDDHMTLNWIWTALALLGAVWALLRLRGWPLKLGFVGYFLLVYQAKGGTPYLNSTYRYFVLMLPIFLMVWDGFEWLRRHTRPWLAWSLAAALYGYDLFTMLLYAGRVHAGWWFYF